jgi:hypothetical protein
MYKVRIKEYEQKHWKVIASFALLEQAKQYAIKLDLLNRKYIDTMYTKIDIKNESTNEWYTIA